MKVHAILLLACLFLVGLVAGTTACRSSPDSITILHTNDTRAHLDNIARRATLISDVRREAGADRVLLLDAGDVFGGTPYYNLYQGQADLWFMQQLKYDAMCLGHHEFDDGIPPVADFINNASFRVLCANFDFSAESGLSKKPFTSVIIKKAGHDYGIFGLTSEDTAEISSPGKNIIINNHLTTAAKVVADLKVRGINRIIAVTSLGWEKDLELAGKVAGIDIIIGGYTGNMPDDYPTVINSGHEPTLVVQAGEFGQYLGRLNVTFDKLGVVQGWTDSKLLAIDDQTPEDTAIAAKLAEYREPIDQLMNTIIGQTRVGLDGERESIRSQETNLGDLVADALLAQAGPSGAKIAIFNSGGIRTSIPAGDITMREVMEVVPFDNFLVSVDLKGAQIIDALENGVSQVEGLAGRFPQVAGIRFTWDSNASPGSRIVEVKIKAETGYQPIDPSATYRVGTNDFILNGGDGYTAFTSGTDMTFGNVIIYNVLAEYIKVNSPLDPRIDGRIIRK
jgi:2',3'-cyclic-nucleotide 2'-phosphodiesterase (5'-nucleotidase family)